jgi:hypothetical protein
MCKKKLYAACAAIVMAVALVTFFPVTGTAGNLEPSAAPGPTMKTLDELTPAWSRFVQSPDRLQLALSMGGDVWLDKTTGLVWAMPGQYEHTWGGAHYNCLVSSVGGVWGWRLPTVEELASIGRSTNVWGFQQSTNYSFWTSTTAPDPSDGTAAYFVGFYFEPALNEIMINYLQGDYKTKAYKTWCVRGGHGYDGK